MHWIVTRVLDSQDIQLAATQYITNFQESIDGVHLLGFWSVRSCIEKLIMDKLDINVTHLFWKKHVYL